MPFCGLFAGLGSTGRSAISLLLSDPCSVLTTLSSPPSFLLPPSLWPICHLSPPVFSGCNGSPDTRFSWAVTRLVIWLDEEHCSCPLRSLVVSLLFSLISILLFSRTGSMLSHQSSLTHGFPRFLPRGLCSLVAPAVFSLVFAAADMAFC